MASLLGLAAALGWGLTDFLARFAGERLGVSRAMLFGQTSAVVLLTLWLAAHPADWRAALGAPVGAWVAGLAAAEVNIAATWALVRGLTRGSVAVVSPVVSSYGAVTALLAWAAGEPVSGLAWGGIATIVGGVALMAWPGHPTTRHGTLGRSLPWAFGSALGFGAGFWLQGTFAVPALGPLLPVWLYYVAGVPTLVLMLRGRAGPLPRVADWPLLAGVGLAGSGAYLAFCAGLQTGAVAVVTVLSSLASGVAILLAGAFLHERLAAHQWAGAAGILAGLALVNAG